MKTIIACLFLCISSVQAAPPPVKETTPTKLTIQSQTITDLYGFNFLYALNADKAILLNRGPRQQDVFHTVTQYATTHNYVITDFTVIGQFQKLEGQHYPVLTQFDIPEFLKKGDPVYILQGKTKLEDERSKLFSNLNPKPQVFPIRTMHDLSKTLVALKKQPPGFLILDVFGVTDEWGDKRSYLAIEETVLSHRLPHVEVGICYRGFKTALALGPTYSQEDAALITQHKNSSSICANLDRLRALGRLDLYIQSAGKFYRVKDKPNPH